MNKSMIVVINYEQCAPCMPYINAIYYNADADYRNVVEAVIVSKDSADSVYVINLDNKDQAFINEILKRGHRV